MTVTLYKESDGRTYYYSIHDQQQQLFGGYELTTSWGVDLNRGRSKRYQFTTQRAMGETFRTLLQRRMQNGYRLLYTFSRESKNDILTRIVNETAS